MDIELWVPPFLSYELWKLRIELRKQAIQTAFEIPTAGSQVMALRSEIMRPTQFLRYLNHFNSDFDP